MWFNRIVCTGKVKSAHSSTTILCVSGTLRAIMGEAITILAFSDYPERAQPEGSISFKVTVWIIHLYGDLWSQQ
jgi:hypothetical protein